MSRTQVRLERPSPTLLVSFLGLVKELRGAGEPFLADAHDLTRDSFDDYLDRLHGFESGLDLADGHVPMRCSGLWWATKWSG